MSLPPTRVPDDADDAAETDGTDDAPVDLVFAGVTSDFTPGTRTVRVRALDISRSFSDVRSVSVGGIHFVRAFVPGSGQDGPYCDYVDVRDCVQGHYSFRGERLVFETTILVDAGECAGEAPLDVPGTDGAPGTDDILEAARTTSADSSHVGKNNQRRLFAPTIDTGQRSHDKRRRIVWSNLPVPRKGDPPSSIEDFSSGDDDSVFGKVEGLCEFLPALLVPRQVVRARMKCRSGAPSA